MCKYACLMMITLMLTFAAPPLVTYAANKAEINRDAAAALANLYENTPAAKARRDWNSSSGMHRWPWRCSIATCGICG